MIVFSYTLTIAEIIWQGSWVKKKLLSQHQRFLLGAWINLWWIYSLLCVLYSPSLSISWSSKILPCQLLTSKFWTDKGESWIMNNWLWKYYILWLNVSWINIEAEIHLFHVRMNYWKHQNRFWIWKITHNYVGNREWF